MGYRDRQAHKQQQKQQSLGQAYTAETRISIPAPELMNTRDDPDSIPLNEAAWLEDMIPTDSGLLVNGKPKQYCVLASTSGVNQVNGFISYNGCGSASAELWAMAASKVFKLASLVGGSASSDAISIGTRAGDYVQFGQTIIWVNGNSNYKWNRASGWEAWSATLSGGDINNLANISKFKNRLIGWEYNSQAFWYSSTDQILGTFNPFDLSQHLKSPLKMFTTITKDGGAGPDDYAVFISETGDAVVYAGTDPGDANAWSMVGRYKIGNPISANSQYVYGQQTVVLCKDDFYFLPEDLQGKRSSTKAAEFRKEETNALSLAVSNAELDSNLGVIVFGDGTILSPKKNFAPSAITFSSAAPAHWLREQYGSLSSAPTSGPQYRAVLATYNDKVYVIPPKEKSDIFTVYQLFPDTKGTFHQKKGKLKTAPIPTPGRTNISLINPIFAVKGNTKTSAGTSYKVIYKAGVMYGDTMDRYATASAELLVTSTASANSEGLWTPGYGTGDRAQIYVEIVTASCSAELYFQGIDVTLTDTGGI